MNAVVKQEVQAPAESSALISMIERAARDPAVDIDKMERLVAMQERALARSSEQAFNDAMAKAQSEMRRVATDSANKQTQSKYASYAALDRAMRPIYTKHSFALSFGTEEGGPADYVRVTCHVSNSGYTRKYQIDMPADGKGAKGGDVMTKTHAVGSAMSYGQRYLLKMIFNIAIGVDDDGNEASGARQNPHVTRPEDVIEEIKYDEDGNPIDNIPLGDPQIQRMTKTMARPEFALMQTEIRNIKTVAELEAWGTKNANRTATLPADWQEFMRDVYRGQLEHLRKVDSPK